MENKEINETNNVDTKSKAAVDEELSTILLTDSYWPSETEASFHCLKTKPKSKPVILAYQPETAPTAMPPMPSPCCKHHEIEQIPETKNIKYEWVLPEPKAIKNERQYSTFNEMLVDRSKSDLFLEAKAAILPQSTPELTYQVEAKYMQDYKAESTPKLESKSKMDMKSKSEAKHKEDELIKIKIKVDPLFKTEFISVEELNSKANNKSSPTVYKESEVSAKSQSDPKSKSSLKSPLISCDDPQYSQLEENSRLKSKSSIKSHLPSETPTTPQSRHKSKSKSNLKGSSESNYESLELATSQSGQPSKIIYEFKSTVTSSTDSRKNSKTSAKLQSNKKTFSPKPDTKKISYQWLDPNPGTTEIYYNKSKPVTIYCSDSDSDTDTRIRNYSFVDAKAVTYDLPASKSQSSVLSEESGYVKRNSCWPVSDKC